MAEFAVVDDSPLVLMAWQMKCKSSATIHTFESPAEFWSAVEADPSFLTRLVCVVTDHYFADGVEDTGLSFGKALKARYNCPVFISTDAILNASDLVGHVDAQIPKGPQTWANLEQYIRKHS